MVHLFLGPSVIYYQVNLIQYKYIILQKYAYAEFEMSTTDIMYLCINKLYTNINIFDFSVNIVFYFILSTTLKTRKSII